MWGFGTALGELPPYFMARAARISGMNMEDEELEEFENLLQRKKKADPSTLVNDLFPHYNSKSNIRFPNFRAGLNEGSYGLKISWRRLGFGVF